MLRYKLTTAHGDVLIALDGGQPNRISPIAYDGSPRAILTIKRWLHYEVGAYGHPIGDWTTPVDLKAAMASGRAKAFSPVLLEETRPDGAQTARAATKTDSEG